MRRGRRRRYGRQAGRRRFRCGTPPGRTCCGGSLIWCAAYPMSSRSRHWPWRGRIWSRSMGRPRPRRCATSRRSSSKPCRPAEEGRLTAISGVEDLFQACAERQRLPHETGLAGWTAPGGARDLRGYAFFAGPAEESPPRSLAWASLGAAPLPDFLAERREQIAARSASWIPATSELTRAAVRTGGDGRLVFVPKPLPAAPWATRVAGEAMADKFLQFLTREPCSRRGRKPEDARRGHDK